MFTTIIIWVRRRNCAPKNANISREDQDAFAIESYQKAQKAQAEGKFKDEITPVELKDKKGDVTLFAEDEEPKAVKFDKIPTLKPVFKKDGTVTAANASTLNDGAAALVLMSKEKADELGIKPLARIISYADAQQAPEWFTTAPSKAIPLALHRAGLSSEQIDYFEINEAFSVVSIANNQQLNLDPGKSKRKWRRSFNWASAGRFRSANYCNFTARITTKRRLNLAQPEFVMAAEVPVQWLSKICVN